VPLDGLDFRTVVPVSVRGAEERGQMNNRASAWILSLPLTERDPRRRHARVRETTEHLKRTRQAQGAQILAELSELAGSLTFLHVGVRLMQLLNPYNLIVTNVPGPPLPLYLMGARLVAGYPLVPLFENQGLGVAIFSYDDRLFWASTAIGTSSRTCITSRTTWRRRSTSSTRSRAPRRCARSAAVACPPHDRSRPPVRLDARCARGPLGRHRPAARRGGRAAGPLVGRPRVEAPPRRSVLPDRSALDADSSRFATAIASSRR
jgi:hypothetical protein